uniref:NADH-ubiquinone oxidoreductase chain 6 n=1 Tax=Cylindraustralia sp. HS-2014 TaxID=1564207 RepID=A0A0N6WAE5_9ORTH|nr:NADH dehydrogenase subunit 6 [Cylindraustralia sp. HS-2014]
MIMITISTTMVLTSMFFMSINHPLSMGMILLIQTTLTSIMSGVYLQSFWYPYILFLIFIGGLLVLFIYVTSISSNELFSISAMNWLMFIVILFTSLLTFWFIHDMFFNQVLFNNNESNQIKFDNSTQDLTTNMTLSWLYNKPSFIMTMLLIIYLFLALEAVSNIINILQGPLRQMS